LGDPTYGHEIEIAQCAADALDDERQRLAEEWEPDERDLAPKLETAAYLAHHLEVDEPTAERLLGALARLGYTRQEAGHDEHGDLVLVWRRMDDSMFHWLFCGWVPPGIAGIDPHQIVLDAARGINDDCSVLVETALRTERAGLALSLSIQIVGKLHAASITGTSPIDPATAAALSATTKGTTP